MPLAKRVRVDDSDVDDEMPDFELALMILKSLPRHGKREMLDEMSVEGRKEMIRMLFDK